MKTALVTGSSGGIGFSICETLAEAGYDVSGFDFTPPRKNDVFKFFQVDISDQQSVQSACQAISAPDLLVNCAGITRDRVCWKMSLKEWQDVIDVNLTGAFLMVRQFAPGFKTRRSGCIINISSINASRGKFGQSNYVASKAALEGLTKTWALELGAYDVRVNAVAPGMVATELTNALPTAVLERAAKERLLERAPQPIDIARAVVFLASDHARCITGQVLKVDSGQS